MSDDDDFMQESDQEECVPSFCPPSLSCSNENSSCFELAIADMNHLPRYDFEYEDEDDDDSGDVDIENKYYNAKQLKLTDPEDAIQEFLGIPPLEEEKGEWGFKGLKQAIKLEFKLGRYEKVWLLASLIPAGTWRLTADRTRPPSTTPSSSRTSSRQSRATTRKSRSTTCWTTLRRARTARPLQRAWSSSTA
jgi:hypothetical protein